MATVGLGPTSLRVAVVAVGLGVLAGCGQTPPAATPTPSARPAGDEAVGIPGDATIGEGIPNLSPEPKPPAITLGDLATRMDAAWADVDSFRAVYTGSEARQPVARVPAVAPAATPAASPTSATPNAGTAATPVGASATTPIAVESVAPRSVLEVIRLDRARQIVSGAGANDHEAVVVGDRVYVRGPLAAVLRPNTPVDAWLELPADAIAAAAGDEDDPASVLAALLAPPASPLAGLPPNLLPQEPRDLGPIEVGGRACRAWGAANTTRTGGRLDITIAIDGDGLPCSIETRAGTEVVGAITWEAFGEPIAIEAPDDATPVAALSATPTGGRD